MSVYRGRELKNDIEKQAKEIYQDATLAAVELLAIDVASRLHIPLLFQRQNCPMISTGGTRSREGIHIRCSYRIAGDLP